MTASDRLFNRDRLSEKLRSGIADLQLTVSSEKQSKLIAYLELLYKWNRAYNLSGIRDPERMVTLHLLDSLTVLPYLPSGNCLDVGTGAGLPGIILAICKPEQHFTLLDSNGKKTRFLVQATGQLALSNVKVENCRVERFQSSRQIDIVLSRAFASLADMTEQVDHLLPAAGKILAMKGAFPEKELNSMPAGWVLNSSVRLEVPGEPGERQLIGLTRRNESEQN